MHPLDAAQLSVRGGEWVRVSSSRGTIDAIRVRVTPIVRTGEVFIPFHWDDRCANRLTDDEFDPISREPNYKQCAVRVERVNPGASGRVTRRKRPRNPSPPR
jgi:assimilatory nitrate reductase catalytic subunit